MTCKSDMRLVNKDFQLFFSIQQLAIMISFFTLKEKGGHGCVEAFHSLMFSKSEAEHS